IKCSPSYPRDRPEVSFNSPIFHPNIDSSYGSVCMSLLDDWQSCLSWGLFLLLACLMYSCYSLLDLVKAMLYLIDHPDFDSPNNSFGILSDLAQLPTMTTRVLAGLPVKGRRFPPNAAWFEWARENDCLPTEEEEAEESRNVMETKSKLDQKGSEVIVA
ncbi:unnamed protein product, partial [Taenia asiatica]|uniref:UBIQUITIN_CONJUGAT_2 domain-containing protein n=1 Tax=Taenia asiatica TaxID=60517 RepID=A0A0R3VZ46_TAEAS